MHGNKSKVPPHCVTEDVCNCGRIKQVDDDLCHSYLQSQDIVNSAEQQKLSPQLVEIFKPYVCPDSECGQQFADNADLHLHELLHNGKEAVSWSAKNPKEMTVV